MKTETSTAAAAFATAAAAPFPDGRRSRAMTLAIVCGILLSAGNRDGVASAFSPPHRALLPMTHIHDAGRAANGIVPAAAFATRTRLAYKHSDSHDEHYDSHAKNETALDGGRSVSVGVDVRVDIKKDVIYYNDLDDEPPASVSDRADDRNVTSAGQPGGSVPSSVVGDDDKELIHELETTIQEKKINLDDDGDDDTATKDSTPPRLKAVEPSKTKPAKKFQSPIQLIRKVPKVEPIHMSTVFFLKLIGDPGWPNKRPESRDPSAKKESDETKKPAIENWKTQMEKRRKGSTAFMASSYLEALSPGAADAMDGNPKQDEDDLMKSLRDQQAQLRREQLQSQKDAMYEANRRTNPQEAIDKRIEEGEKLRKKKERERLERLYVERKERLDAKKRNERRYSEERERQEEILEGKARERSEAEAGEAETVDGAEEKAPLKFTSRNGKRGIPILDRPYVKAPPLLIGRTLTISCSELTPFQKRAVEVAREYHETHCEGMNDPDDSLCRVGEDAGIQAAPIIAVIDGYTAAATEALESHLPSSQRPKTSRRYATLASIEVVESANSEEPSAVKLMGVGRAFLHDYFSSEDAGMTPEEEELSELLARIQNFDRQESYAEDEEEERIPEADDDGEEDEDLPAVMAEFDLVLDDSSVIPSDDPSSAEVTQRRASSMHAVTELYRCANRVYRLHEERKKLVAGLRAGVARLRLGKEGGKVAEDCSAEFEDCDGLGGLFAGVLDDGAADESSEEGTTTLSTVDAPRSRLETLENYGLGSYGVLSTLPDLTRELLVRLEPYYSPAHREREEHEVEAASFAALRSVEAYAGPDEVAEALVVPRSATERLERARAIMARHREELVELAERIGRELMECGEECTDLW